MKTLLFVHGAGITARDYYKDSLAAITALLGSEPPHAAVYYADISELASTVASAAPPALSTQPVPMGRAVRPPHLFVVAGEANGQSGESPEVAQFKAGFMNQVQVEQNAPPAGARTAAMVMLPGRTLFDIIATDLNQIATYLFDRETTAETQTRMLAGLDEAAPLGDSIVIAALSLGTVVAFDALVAAAGQYRISTFITLGSPLAKLRQLGQRTSDLGEITHEHIGEWLNFWDTTDPISNALGPAFPRPGYRLHDIFVDVAPLPPASHDYMRNREVLAAIADALR